MHTLRIGTLALASSIAMTTGCSRHGDSSREQAALRKAWNEACEAFTAKDWNRYAQVWAHEPGLQVIHPPQREWLKGWPAVEERYRGIFASDAKWKFETRQFYAQISPSGDAAWATIETVLILNGNSQTAWQVAVFKKISGEWKVALAFSAPVSAK
jgi:hypothetical protein